MQDHCIYCIHCTSPDLDPHPRLVRAGQARDDGTSDRRAVDGPHLALVAAVPAHPVWTVERFAASH
jgi:hypothetical protein